jgi:hypothetical protein
MPRITRRSLILGLLLLVLAASLAANLILYRQASRPLYTERDRPLVDRTIAHFAASARMSEAQIRAQSFPIVLSMGRDLNCVELRRYDGLGSQSACYDAQGRVVSEAESVVH